MDDFHPPLSALQEGLAQTKLFVREHTNGHWDWRLERRVARGMHVPPLPRTRRRHAVWGVSVFRDEVDIAMQTIDHMLAQGVDHLLVADHGSTDGTRELLLHRADEDDRLHVALDSSRGHFQKEKVTHLSRLAWRAGARWVVPFDADEWWFARGQTLKQFFARSEARLVRAQTVNALVVTRGAIDSTSEMIFDPSASAAEKVAFRSHPLALVGPGNHGVARVGNQASGLVIAHVPYRSAAQLLRKCRVGAQALDEAWASESEGWHWRAGAKLSLAQAEKMWGEMCGGSPAPQIGWAAAHLDARERVLTWRSWDPSGVVAIPDFNGAVEG